MANVSVWQKRIEAIMSAKSGGFTPEVNLEVVEFQPNRDKKDLFIFSGNTDSVITQISLFKALHEYLESKLDNKTDFDFNSWANQFEDGFIQLVKKNQDWQLPNRPWGESFDARPKIWNLSTPEDTAKGNLTIEFFPDRNNPYESYLFFGSPKELIYQISEFWREWQLLKEYDWGAIVGEPLGEYSRKRPNQKISLHFWLTNRKEPPFWKNNSQWFTRRQVTIPDANRALLTYQKLRDVCGGENGQLWGEYVARAYVGAGDDLTKLSQVTASGTSKQQAKSNLKSFLTLTNLPIRRITINEIQLDEGEDALDPNVPNKRSFRVYPHFVSIRNSALVRADDLMFKGKPTLSGKLVSKENKIYLYSPIPFRGAEAKLNDLTRPVLGDGNI